MALHGAPAYLRSDNGPEFVAVAVQLWLVQRQIRTLYIDPGCPWQNGKEERFNGSVRDECLNMHLFTSASDADVRGHLATLPLVKAGMMDIAAVVPLNPYPGFGPKR